MRRIFIINGINKKAFRLARELYQISESEQLDSIFISTSYAKEAIAMASYWASPDNVIYSVGGDGTLNEVINGIAGKDTSLGIIPCGTGNDFYKVINEDTQKIDVMKVNEYYAINVLSFGLDAEVANKANELKDKGKKKGVYIRSLLSVLPQFECPVVSIDGKEQAITILAICNGKYYGHGIPINPCANIDDGELECYCASYISKAKIPFLFGKLVKGNHIGCPEVTAKSIHHMVVSSNRELLCNMDGEIIRNHHFDIALFPSLISLYKESNLQIRKLILKCNL